MIKVVRTVDEIRVALLRERDELAAWMEGI